MQTLYRFKGSVSTLAELQLKENNVLGDVWNCKQDNKNYCWNKEEWVDIGLVIDVSGLATNQDIQFIEEEIDLNKIHIYTMTVTQDTELGAEITLPFYYKVGNGSLFQVQYFEYMLLKAVNDDSQGQYYELGEANSISNKILLASDAKLKAGDILTFYVKGEWSNEQDAG